MVSVVMLWSPGSKGTVIFTVLSLLELAVNVSTVVLFCWIVKVPLLTVGIVGLLERSVYEPEVATVEKLGLPVTLPHAIVVGTLIVILPLASLATVALPEPAILYWCLRVELSNNFI